VVDLRQHPDVAVLQAVDQVDLPQRPRTVERPREDARYLLSHLGIRRRRRDRELADVVLEVELGIVDPVGIVEPQRDRFQPPAERGQQRKPLGDHVVDVGELEPSVWPRAWVEHGETANVASLTGRLQRQELRVKSGQLPHTRLAGESIRARVRLAFMDP
jgi:hypothetical protein